LVAEWKGEGKVGGLILRVREHVAELKHKLLVTVEKGLCFGHYPAPFLLVAWHHSVGRLQPLVVQFGLIVTSSYKD